MLELIIIAAVAFVVLKIGASILRETRTRRWLYKEEKVVNERECNTSELQVDILTAIKPYLVGENILICFEFVERKHKSYSSTFEELFSPYDSDYRANVLTPTRVISAWLIHEVIPEPGVHIIPIRHKNGGVGAQDLSSIMNIHESSSITLRDSQARTEYVVYADLHNGQILSFEFQSAANAQRFGTLLRNAMLQANQRQP